MRIALLSDVHGNLEAFAAVLEDCKQIRIDKYAFLGDLVMKGPSSKDYSFGEAK